MNHIVSTENTVAGDLKSCWIILRQLEYGHALPKIQLKQLHTEEFIVVLYESHCANWKYGRTWPEIRLKQSEYE